jgi:FAD/FMN-containing dehydrogenase
MPVSRKHFVKSFFLLIATFKNRHSIPFVLNGKEKNPPSYRRVRPGDAGWPAEKDWGLLNDEVKGKLIKMNNPFISPAPDLFSNLKNPYYIGDTPELTQTVGWANAWKSSPSVYAVASESAGDAAAAINFARKYKLRLVVKGGGHSYLGGSNSADSLMIWTRKMNSVTVHDSFMPQGSLTGEPPVPAVTIGAGAIWGHVYDEVSAKHGRYVQGGGCLTVGVAGLVQGGGFGSFSKYYGVAAAGLLEAEIVTADGKIQIVNAQKNPDLFWAIRGGGGGSFGVVTKLTLATKELPETFGVVFGKIKAISDDAFKTLIEKMLILYKEHLFNPQWGEQMIFNPDRSARVSMLFHGLTREAATSAWQEFQDWIKDHASDYSIEQPLTFVIMPAKDIWSPAFLKKFAPDFVATDNRTGASEDNIFWKGNQGEAGQFLYAYHSAWLPESLLETNQIKLLTDALFHAGKYWNTSLHFNKGLAGANPEVLTAARNTAVHPALGNAFALVIIAAEEQPCYPGLAGHEPDMKKANNAAEKITKAINEIKSRVATTGSYVSETDFFEEKWQDSFWGSNYERLLSIKDKYDPEGLFFVHHGVGSESWSPDGFTKLK